MRIYSSTKTKKKNKDFYFILIYYYFLIVQTLPSTCWSDCSWMKKQKCSADFLPGSTQATEITRDQMVHQESSSKILIRTCKNDAVCIPYCPKSCKRVPSPYQSRCWVDFLWRVYSYQCPVCREFSLMAVPRVLYQNKILWCNNIWRCISLTK